LAFLFAGTFTVLISTDMDHTQVLVAVAFLAVVTVLLIIWQFRANHPRV